MECGFTQWNDIYLHPLPFWYVILYVIFQVWYVIFQVLGVYLKCAVVGRQIVKFDI